MTLKLTSSFMKVFTPYRYFNSTYIFNSRQCNKNKTLPILWFLTRVFTPTETSYRSYKNKLSTLPTDIKMACPSTKCTLVRNKHWFGTQLKPNKCYLPLLYWIGEIEKVSNDPKTDSWFGIVILLDHFSEMHWGSSLNQNFRSERGL